MTKNVLLINPYTTSPDGRNNRYIPLGILYIASSTLKSGYNVKFKDLRNELLDKEKDEINSYFDNDFIKFLNKSKPDIVGISILFAMRFEGAIKIAKIVRKIFKDVPIVFGGPHSTLFYKQILEEYNYIDYIILGEGDQSFIKLLDAHFNNKNLLSKIDGIAYRKKGKVIINPKTTYINDLDSIPFPAYELINPKDYYYDTSSWHNPKGVPIDTNFSIITSRGCPRRCTYCTMKDFHGRKYRERSAKNLVDEIQYLYDKHNCRYVSFVDDNMTISKKRILEIMHDICERKLEIQFDTSQGVEINTLDKEMLDAMIKAGYIRVTVGIESGSDYIRNTIFKKGLKNDTIYDFFKMAKKYKNLSFVGYFICGCPQETKETLNDTFEMVKRLPLAEISLSVMIPVYGTEMFNYCLKEGLLDEYVIKNLHKISYSYRDGYFIKPYNLDISYIKDFKKMILSYVEERKKDIIKVGNEKYFNDPRD